ncbi:uncharacterized protein GJ701_006080 isoform 6-T12 [Geothlypis trichas]
MQRKIKKRNRDIESQSDRTSPSTRRVANDSAGLDPRLKFPKAPPRAGALGSLAPVQAPPRAGALGSLAPVQAPPRAGALGSLAPVQAPPRAGALGSLAPVQAPPLTPVPAPPPETPPPPRPPHAHKTRRIRARPAFLRGCWSGVLRERLSERCEEVGIRGCCCVEPAVLRGCSQQAAEMLQPGQTPPTAQKDPKEPLALPGMEAQAVYRGPQTAVPVSDLPELPHSCQILDPKQYALEMP